jgi:hypothetical protein
MRRYLFKLKGVSTKLSDEEILDILRKALVVIACVVFLFSVISPFYTISMKTLAGGSSTYYSSYESDYQYAIMAHFGSSKTWFSDYWFSPYLGVGLGIPWILIAMFIIQVLTLLFGVASIIFNRRILSFAPVLLSLLTIALMVYTGMVEQIYLGEYQLGFYLVFPSLVLFLSAFVLNEVRKKSRLAKTILDFLFPLFFR